MSVSVVIQLIPEKETLTEKEMPVQKRKETEKETLIHDDVAIVVKDEGSMMVHLHWIHDHWAYIINFYYSLII